MSSAALPISPTAINLPASTTDGVVLDVLLSRPAGLPSTPIVSISFVVSGAGPLTNLKLLGADTSTGALVTWLNGSDFNIANANLLIRATSSPHAATSGQTHGIVINATGLTRFQLLASCINATVLTVNANLF